MRRHQTQSSALITGSYLQLQDVLLRLSELTDAMMLAHQKDYVSAYKDHMVKVQCELIHVKKRTSEFYLRLAKDERMRYLEQTVQWLRTEALSLARSLQELKKHNEELRRALEQARDERRFLVEYSRSTKRHNRLLSQTVEQLKDGTVRQRYERRSLDTQPKPAKVGSSSLFSCSQEPTAHGGRAATAHETILFSGPVRETRDAHPPGTANSSVTGQRLRNPRRKQAVSLSTNPVRTNPLSPGGNASSTLNLQTTALNSSTLTPQNPTFNNQRINSSLVLTRPGQPDEGRLREEAARKDALILALKRQISQLK